MSYFTYNMIHIYNNLIHYDVRLNIVRIFIPLLTKLLLITLKHLY